MIYHVDTWERAFELAREHDAKIVVHVEEPCVICCREDKGQPKTDHAIYPPFSGSREPVAVRLESCGAQS